MYVYSSILSSNDEIKETPINEIKEKKLNSNSILVSMSMYVYMDTCIYLNAYIDVCL
jgi:hypothetical protein